MARRYGLVAGPLLATLLYLWIPEVLPDPAGGELQLGTAGRMTGALVGWMAIWWMTEAIPIFVTALLPAIVLPLSGAQGFFDTTAVYAHPLIFLAMGGFVLALALERWNLHRRFATFVLRFVGNGPRRLVGGFMIVGAALSMWISNRAASVIMLPIALIIIAADNQTTDYHPRFRLCLLLGTAYACSIGGMGTLIGTGTNVFLASFVESELQRDMSFVGWMRLGVPLVLVFLPLAWLLLTRVIFRLPAVGETDTRALLPEQEPWSAGEKRTFAVFCLALVGWVGSPLLAELPLFGNLSDSGVAMLCLLLLFLIPDGRGGDSTLMDWDTAVKLPWGVLLLLGGGLALAGAIDDNGIGAALALQSAKLQGVPPVLVVVFAAMAGGMGIDPPGDHHPDRAGCELRVHAAGGHAAEQHRVRLRHAAHPRHGARRHLDQHIRDRVDLANGLSAGRYAVLIRPTPAHSGQDRAR